jgi:hypothetical protein
MKNFKRAIVFMIFFCLASAWTFLAQGQESIKPVACEKLAGFLTDPPGFNKDGDLECIQVPVPAKSEVWQAYVSGTGKRSLEINIMDSAKSMINLIPIKGMMHNRKDSQGYAQTITINDFPAVKTYDNSSKEAGLIVLIKDRFVLQMFGHNFTAAEVPGLVEAAKKHNLEKIAELGE